MSKIESDKLSRMIKEIRSECLAIAKEGRPVYFYEWDRPNNLVWVIIGAAFKTLLLAILLGFLMFIFGGGGSITTSVLSIYLPLGLLYFTVTGTTDEINNAEINACGPIFKEAILRTIKKGKFSNEMADQAVRDIYINDPFNPPWKSMGLRSSIVKPTERIETVLNGFFLGFKTPGTRYGAFVGKGPTFIREDTGKPIRGGRIA